MSELITWLRAQIEADKEAAQYAQVVAPGIWWHNHDDAPGIIYTEEGGELLRAPEEHRPLTEHLVRHEPQEVIARCDAGLALLDHYREMCDLLDPTTSARQEYILAEGAVRRAVTLLAQGYRHRDGYREEWRP